MSDKQTNIEHYKRDCVHASLEDFCVFAKENDFIEVSLWHNCEGYDVTVGSARGHQLIQLTCGELRAISALTAVL